MALQERIILFGMQGCVDSTSGDEILLWPPLCVSEDEIDETITVLEGCLTKLENELLSHSVLQPIGMKDQESADMEDRIDVGAI